MPNLSPAVLIGVYALCWVGLHLGAGLIAHLLPDRALRWARWWYHPRAFEQSGRLYRRLFRIHRWKHLVPEAGNFYRGGFTKRALDRSDPAYAERFVLETYRAEFSHWLTIALAFTFQLWNDWYVTVLMLFYAGAVNLPCIIIQRYNRPRLLRLYERLSREESRCALSR